jgi:hypothetical protein
MKCHKIRGHNCFFLMANMNFNGEEERREKKKGRPGDNSSL